MAQAVRVRVSPSAPKALGISGGPGVSYRNNDNLAADDGSVLPNSDVRSRGGFEAFEDARMKFDVRYYLIAILFILFDLEVAFLVPWATIFKDIVATDAIKVFGFVEMLIFVAILTVGYVYAWAKGALEWE